MSLFLEKYYPFLISLILGFCAYYFRLDLKLNYADFFNTSLSVFSILIGFLLTVATIIQSLDNEVIGFIKKSDKYFLFLNYLKNAIITNINSIILCLYFQLNKDLCTSFLEYINPLLLFFISLSMFSSYRFIKIFIKIIIR